MISSYDSLFFECLFEVLKLMWKLRKFDRNIDFSRKTKKKRSGVIFWAFES